MKVVFDINKEELKNLELELAKQVGEPLSERLLAKAKEIVPVKTGKLRDSGRVNHYKTGFSISFNTDYALAVHERPNGRGKYITRAVRAFERD